MAETNEFSALDDSAEKKKYYDHDGFWKDLIARFFYPLLMRSLPELYVKADIAKEPHFLDKEFRDILNTSDPDLHTSPHFADYVLEVPLKSGEVEWVLLHIEAQGPRGGNLAVRMHHYECLIYAHYRREPIALAIITDRRPKNEAAYYSYSDCGTELVYRYNILAVRDLGEQELLSSENPIDLVLYATKGALDCKEELQKYRYLRTLAKLLAERGWSLADKRDLMLFIERVINLKDEQLMDQYREYQRQFDEEGKSMYVSLVERSVRREYEQEFKLKLEQELEQKLVEERQSSARKMLARQMSIDVIADLTELSEDEIRGLMD
jgi:hypothetical protein